MIVKNITVNGTEFRVTLTEPIMGHVRSLKKLYETAYEDPESFDQISYQISNMINEIASAAEPKVSDDSLDGLIQEIIRAVENREAEVEKMTSEMAKKAKKRKH